MTPEQQAEHDAAQRESFVRGNVELDRIERAEKMTRMMKPKPNETKPAFSERDLTAAQNIVISVYKQEFGYPKYIDVAKLIDNIAAAIAAEREECAAAERANIVAWLREQLAMLRVALPGRNTLYFDTVDAFADAIERGEGKP